VFKGTIITGGTDSSVQGTVSISRSTSGSIDEVGGTVRLSHFSNNQTLIMEYQLDNPARAQDMGLDMSGRLNMVRWHGVPTDCGSRPQCDVGSYLQTPPVQGALAAAAARGPRRSALVNPLPAAVHPDAAPRVAASARPLAAPALCKA